MSLLAAFRALFSGANLLFVCSFQGGFVSLNSSGVIAAILSAWAILTWRSFDVGGS